LKDLIEVKALLEAEAPKGASPDPFEETLVAEAAETEKRTATRGKGTAR
jgi:hypothetical protein